MPWSNQSGGGGWKGGGGGPWGPRPGPGQQPDLEEILRRSQDRLRQAMPGGRMGGPFAVLLAVVLIALIGFFGFTVRVNPDELGIVLRRAPSLDASDGMVEALVSVVNNGGG